MMSYWMETTFRVLDDEDVAEIQHLYWDQRWHMWELAERFGVHENTVRKAVRCVPEHLVTVRRSAKRAS